MEVLASTTFVDDPVASPVKKHRDKNSTQPCIIVVALMTVGAPPSPLLMRRPLGGGKLRIKGFHHLRTTACSYRPHHRRRVTQSSACRGMRGASRSTIAVFGRQAQPPTAFRLRRASQDPLLEG
ncbi:hypothetical protein I4F81_012291 [Pyropia yezoensis]|nr:hypothetical protein I4F81_012291 [Neopyropia yezoensis]